MNLKWPPLPVLRNKRDIDAAFKRVKVHPDMCIIVRAEFAAPLLGIEDGDATIIFLYLTSPFGRTASPAYFSKIWERNRPIASRIHFSRWK